MKTLLSAEELYTKGCNAVKLKKYNTAIHYWKKSIEINPNSEKVYNKMGKAYNAINNYDSRP